MDRLLPESAINEFRTGDKKLNLQLNIIWLILNQTK